MQQAKSEIDERRAAWTVGVREMRPKRGSVRAVFSIEDQARLPGLEDALQRDLRAALADSIDAAIFKGDSGPAGTSADIIGLQTAAITEFTLTQANKVKGPQTLAEFIGLGGRKARGVAGGFGRRRQRRGQRPVVEHVDQFSAVDNATVAQFLMASGLAWFARADIDTATSKRRFRGLRRPAQGPGRRGRRSRVGSRDADSGSVQRRQQGRGRVDHQLFVGLRRTEAEFSFCAA